MSEHYTRATVSASAWCSKCQRYTQHRVDDKRKGPCLDCIAKLDAQHAAKPKPEAPKQESLFGIA